jgi:hypothetical protein
MPTVLQFRRGTTSQNNSFTGTLSEISVDTTLDTLRLHDGSTAGGFEITQNAAAQTLTNKTLTTPVLTTPIANAGVQLKNGATSAGFLEFFEDSDNGTNKATLIGPASTADVTITLPAATGTVALTANVLALAGGTMAGAIAMGTSKITGAGDPTAAQDVATKAYVDAEVTAVTPVISAGNSNVTVTDSGTGQVVTTVDGVAEVTTVSASTTFGGNLVIPNGGTIGTVGDGDSITIATAGAVTISQALTVTGNLTVNGTTTTLNTAEMKVEDLNITLADGAADSAAADGAGITIDGAAATITYAHSGTKFVFNKPIDAGSNSITSSGGFAGTAAIATAVTCADESSDTTCFPTFVTGATGNLETKTGTNLTFNSSSGLLTATAFAGALTGDVTGNASGTAGIATLVTVSDNESTNESNVILFAAGAAGSGNLGVEADGNMTYNPSTGKITAVGFIGALTGTADVATVATTVTITDNESTNESNALIFTAGGDVDGGNLGLESDGTLTYNPSTGLVTATGFVGTLAGAVTGNVTGTASIATTITLVATNATDATHFPVFVDTATGNENPRTDTGFTYNSNSGTLTSSVFAGEATSALYADVAEMYLPDADYSAGTVVCIGGSEEVTSCSTSDLPAGVVSTDPAYLMNAGLEDGVAVGLVGRLPVRVVGAVTKGQVVKVDSDGVASATGTGERVGVALETSDVAGEKLIECMLKT